VISVFITVFQEVHPALLEVTKVNLPDADNELLIRRIAEMGIAHVQTIERKESITEDDSRIEYLRSLVNQEFRMNVNDMMNEINTWQNANSSNNLVHTV
jgi:hypothetical protein